jgi:type I restriction enzyme S subunit
MKKGGIKKPLGDVFETVTGNTPSKSNAEYYGRHLPLVKPPELQDCELSEAEDGLSEEGARVARVAPPSSILVSCIGNLGKIGFNTVPVAFNQQINAIIPNRSLAIPEFFFYQVLSCRFRNQLESLASGTTVSIVNKSRFNSIEIVLPPLSEQQRIVGVLDEAFASLATAQAHAAQNLQNARALFESHLQAVFTNEIFANYTHRLSDFCERITKGSSPKWQGMAYVKKPGVLFVTSENVHENRLIVDEPKYVEERFNNKEKRSILKRGDVLTNLVGASIGRTAVYDLDDVANINQAVGLIRCHADKMYNHYLMYYLNSPSMKAHFHSNEVNNARANISLSFVSEVEVPVTTIEHQKAVVERIRDFHRETQRLESIYQRKLAAIDEFKKSILHQAFSGEL